MPAIHFINPYPQVFILLFLGLASYGLFFLALIRNVKQPPSTVVTTIQDAWSINCHPGLTLDEFSREMQNAWAEKTPNRIYSHIEPVIDLNEKSGKFYSEALEESQPLPLNGELVTLNHVKNTPRLQPLLWLDIAGAAFITISTILVVIMSISLLDIHHVGEFPGNLFAYAIVFFSLGFFQISAAHTLWRRFEFTSRLTCMEMSGHYVMAEIDHGNVIRDTVKTNSSVIQVESMTFRLWVTEMTSVIFDKDGQRFIISMAGDPSRGNNLSAQLRKFAEEQAIILAPKAKADIERHAALSAFNEPAALPPGSDGSFLLPGEHGEQANVAMIQTPSSAKFCGACGNPLIANAAFCSSCGKPVSAH